MTSFLVRQLFVAASPQLAALSVGGAVTFPSVLLQQLNGNDTTIVLDYETASWIGSIHGLAGLPSILMPTLMQWRGRKIAFIVACLFVLLGWMLALAATDSAAILISEALHGLGNSSVLGVGLLSMSEMVSPKIRNVAMISYPLVQGFGMTLCVILGRYLHWKTVSWIMSIPICLAVLLRFLWPESPSWLAYKGRFDKCEKTFKWLRGTDEASNEEFNELISAQREKYTESRTNRGFTFRLRTLLHRDFYLPCFHTFILILMTYATGLVVIIIYMAEIVRSTTQNEDAAFYGSILVNVAMFLAVVTSAVLSRRFPNKCIMMLSSFFSVVSLLLSSSSMYLQSIEVLSKDSVIGVIFLVVFVFSVCSGMYPVGFSVAAEVMPVKHRGVGGAFFVTLTCLLHSVCLKLAPYLFHYLRVARTLMIYAANALMCGLYMWKYIPETKGRTLQEIEDFYTYDRFETKRNERFSLTQPLAK